MMQRCLSTCRSGFSPTILLSLLLGLPFSTHAHEVRPAYLEIVEQSDGIYSLTWKQPSLAEARIAIDPALPQAWRASHTRCAQHRRARR